MYVTITHVDKFDFFCTSRARCRFKDLEGNSLKQRLKHYTDKFDSRHLQCHSGGVLVIYNTRLTGHVLKNGGCAREERSEEIPR